MYLKRNAAPQAKFCSALCWKWLVIWSQLLSEAGASTWSCSSRLQVTAGRLIYRLSWKHASPSGQARWSQAMICWTSNSKRSGENVTGQAVTTVPSRVGLPAEISTCNVLNISRHWINSKRSRRFRTLTDTAGGLGGDGLTFYCGDRRLDLLSEPLCSSTRKQAVNNARLRPQCRCYLKKKEHTTYTNNTLVLESASCFTACFHTLHVCGTWAHFSVCMWVGEYQCRRYFLFYFNCWYFEINWAELQ